MRIVGGEHSGRPIIAPKGDRTRPTTDRARESLFNILAHGIGVGFEGARIIDAFAGSGALGLEAMSRGGAFCLFIETDAAARGAIRDNIEALRLFGATRIHRRSATDLGAKPAGLGGPFTLAFLDPPYGKGLAQQAIDSLAAGGWLADGAVVVVEQGADEDAAISDAYEELDRREMGPAQFGFLSFKGA
ncbi:MAG: 16S rRNA (guanine(966)-N(2))-methyltransferase RsmD [Pseudomonadota bacterium]